MLLVIVYHVRPEWVPGGFVGVDVFFVISGYLITGSLAAEALRSGSVRLSAFWARRVRRLMPAATVVLAAVLVAMTALLPVGVWPRVIGQVVASALSAQNWVLAAQSVDYLQATNQPTPVQHFWSLSVEEQFYVVWPLLILGGIWLSRRTRVTPLKVMQWVTVVLALGFFVWSIVETTLSPSTAYFSTATRAWELLLGGAIALFVRSTTSIALWAGRVAASMGLGMIGAAALVITPSSAFPGWIALLPTVGAALVIIGGIAPAAKGAFDAHLRLPPLTYVGDISYSLYLWHWPVIIYLSVFFAAEPQLPGPWAVAGVAASLGLAALSTRFIERPFQVVREGKPVWTPRRSALLGAALLTTTALFVGGASLNFVRAADQLRADSNPRNFPGARILDPQFDPSQWNLAPVPPIPDPLSLVNIEPQLTPECLTLLADTEVTTCMAGDPRATTLVMLVGDSHAGQWLPAVDAVAKQQHWRVIFAGKQYCTMSAADKFYSRDDPKWTYPQCAQWNEALAQLITAERPSLVIQGALSYGYPHWMTSSFADYDRDRATGYAQAWTKLLDSGIAVVALREVPRLTHTAVDCMGRPGASIESCSEPLAPLQAAAPSWLELAATIEPRVPVIDLNPGLCPEGICRPVIGNIYTYRDDSHVSAPYSESLAWMLEAGLRASEPGLF